MARLAVAIALVAALAACGKKQRERRIAGDGGPVEVIAETGSGSAAPAARATTDEVEPNDGADTATPLPLGSTVRGKMESEADADYFRIDVTQAGALSIAVNDVAADLVLELEDAGGTLVARSDRGAVRTREGLPNFGVTPGRYTAVVRTKKAPTKKARPKKGKAPPPAATPPAPIAYEITAAVAPPAKGTEREPDDDRGTANDLIPGETVSAFIGWNGDADVWKLSIEALSAKNVLDLEVEQVDGVALALELADGIGQPLLSRKAPKNTKLVVRGLVLVVPPGSPPFHYVTIKGDKSNHETPYKLRAIAQVPGQDPEAEPNDSLEKPMPFPADRTIVNAVWSPGDVDCFEVAPEPDPRTLEVLVETPSEADLSAELYLDGKVIAKSEVKGKGAAEKLSGAIPANGKPIIRVRGSEGGGEGTYEVKISDGPAPPER